MRAAGVAFEVVPGVTAGVAAPAYAGIPVTHRGLASAVALITGHEDPDKEEMSLDWPALAAFPGTLVFYMGVRRLGAIADSLIAAGRAPEEPAAVVERGTLPGQRRVLGDACDDRRAAAAARRARPVDHARRGGRGARRASSPGARRCRSSGLTVAVTRARAQASSLAERLRAAGRPRAAGTRRSAPSRCPGPRPTSRAMTSSV